MKTILTLALTVVATASVLAQGDIPSGTISGSGSGPYTYDITFSDSASSTSPIGSIWYAWVPGQFFLPGTPSGASAPSGWTANIVANSIQFTANSAANDIPIGGSLSGFTYNASFSPSTLFGTANSGKSDAYMAGLETDAGEIFFVTQTVPEPSTLALLGIGAGALVGFARRRRA